jgi:hypothetical protein
VKKLAPSSMACQKGSLHPGSPTMFYNELRIDAAGKTTVKRTEASAAASVQLN